ncbi:MAG: hypothetical protein U0869_09655 [Chloroflexota bacterium]
MGRRSLVPVASVVLAVVAAASGALVPLAASAADTPEGAVNEVLDAYVAKQFDRIGPLVCDAHRDAIVGQLDLAQAFGDEGVDPAPLIDGLTIAIDGRSVRQASEDGDRAAVDVTGTVRISVDEAAARAWVGNTLTVLGQETSPAQVDEYLGYFVDSLEAPQDLTSTVSVVREGGTWRLCDDLQGGQALGSFDPGASPATAIDPLCDTMTIEELDAASGLAFTTATALDGGCSWDPDLAAADYFNVSIYRANGDLQLVKDAWPAGADATIAGHAAWTSDMGTWVQLDDGLLTIMPYLTGSTVELISPVELALRVGELVVPRLP